MSQIGEIPGPEVLKEFLRTFSASAQEKGEYCFRRDQVRGVHTVVAGSIYESTVQGDALFLVRLFYDLSKGSWLGVCGCPVGTKCCHIYASGKALLAEHSSALVDDLVSGVKQASTSGQNLSELAKRLMTDLGRNLTAEEGAYLRLVHRVFLRAQQSRILMNQDLRELGIPTGRSPWESAQLWQEFPQDEYWFWQYVARAAKEHKAAIPAFMAPVTDLVEIERLIVERQRQRVIQQWTQQLASFRPPLVASHETANQGYDFRIAFAPSSASLEWKRPGQDAFESVRLNQLRELIVRNPAALGELPSEAEIILQAFAPLTSTYANAAQLNYYDATHKALLTRLLLKPALANRTVDESGVPLERVAEPLRWSLTEPGQSQSNNYRVRLVQANGRPLPEFLFNVESNPALYVAAHSVFFGPPRPSFLAATPVTQIPAAAVESAAGVRFLQQLGLALPQRIQERVRRVPFEVKVRCWLDRLHGSSGPEICALEVTAVSADGCMRRHWSGQNWIVNQPTALPVSEANDGPIVVYDDQPLDEVTLLLAPLAPRPSASMHRSGVYVRVTKTFPELFAEWLRSMPPHIPLELEGELATLAQQAVSGRVRLDVSEAEIDWFDLKVVLDLTDATLNQEEVKLLLDARGGFVRLKNKGWRRLKFELTAEDDEQLARLGLTARELTSEPQRLHALQLSDQAARRFLPEVQVEKIHRRTAEIKARVTPEVPGNIRAELRPYQREGFHFLAYLSENRFGGILADDMGLGKTVQTLTWLSWLHQRWQQSETTPVPPTLVVCPKSVMDNWHAEAAKFAPQLRVRLWSSGQLDDFMESLADADLHVLNYAQLRSVGEGLASIRWLAVILDEGQYIKNPNSQTAQVARALKATHRLILSGTPIENRLLDLWSLMMFAMPGTLGSRAHFARLYDSKGDPFARRRLAARVRPFLLRRTKAQVAKDLPDRVEEDLLCEIEGEQRTLYRAELKRAQQMLLAVNTQQELAKQQFHFLTSLLRLRQICCHPRLYKPDSSADGAKSDALLEQLEPLMEEGHKVLVFSQFVELLDLLKPTLEARGWPIFYLVGSTEDRGDLVAKFQQTEGAAIFLISIKAGGFGLNLTAASYVILFDPWWNPAVENQAIDRTHRIGQTNKVIAYRLLIKNSIEEKIRLLQKKKAALMEDVLGEEKFAQSLTMDDLRYLLADD